MDKISKSKRSWNMSRIKGKNTSPELKVRSLLHGLGYRFRLHRKDLPGCPDIVLPKLQKVIFVHGCFWHRHQGCKYATTPSTNVDFWLRKFDVNVERDREVQKRLKQLGWTVLVIWECDLKDSTKLKRKLSAFLGDID